MEVSLNPESLFFFFGLREDATWTSILGFIRKRSSNQIEMIRRAPRLSPRADQPGMATNIVAMKKQSRDKVKKEIEHGTSDGTGLEACDAY
jgi:hypothetical protein